MHYNYFLSDLHLGHTNILSFTDNDGNLIRGKRFSSIEEHDETIIENINKRVRIQDKLYLLGDVVMNKRCLSILDRINTKKRILIKGNHDIFKLKEYLPYFTDIRAYKVLPKSHIIFSHIPIHPCDLNERFKWNGHGHTHHNKIDDKRYINLSCEQTDYKPLELEEILKTLDNR